MQEVTMQEQEVAMHEAVQSREADAPAPGTPPGRVRTVRTPMGAMTLVVKGGSLVEVRWPHVGTRANGAPAAPADRDGAVAAGADAHDGRSRGREGSIRGREGSTGGRDGSIRGTDVLDRAADQLHAYFSGRVRAFDVPLSPAGTPFQLAVWRAVAAIPYGETRSYGQIARQLGRPTAARAVGRAVGLNPLPLLIPCHRVVGSDGRLTGFAGGLQAKERLLALEADAAGAQSSGR